MKPNILFAALFYICIPFFSFAQENKETVSDNDSFNRFCLSIVSPQLESRRETIRSVEVRKAKPMDDLFQNMVRIWFTDNTYVNVINKVYPSEQSALQALPDTFESSQGTFCFDWSYITSPSLSFNLRGAHFNSFINRVQGNLKKHSITPADNLYQQGVYELKQFSINKTKIAKGDGTSRVFYLPEPVSDSKSVNIYVGWKRLKPTEYEIEPYNRKIVLHNPPKKNRKVSVKYNSEEYEFHFSFSFDNLSFDSNQQVLMGKDGNNEFQNASFFSKMNYVDFTSTKDKSWSSLVDNPFRPGDKVLRFLAKQTNDRSSNVDKVRIHGNVKSVPAVAFDNSVDVYIPTDWAVLSQYDEEINWLTQQEYWCSSSGSPRDGYPQFRITVGMLKEKGVNKQLYYYLKCQDLFTTVKENGLLNEKYVTLYEKDHRKDHNFAIPLGEWFNVRTIVKSGNSDSGHFKMIVTTQDGKEHIIFDEICPTRATGYDLPGANEALYSSLTPLKLYTSGAILDFFNSKGKSLSIYYNNWEFFGTCVNHKL